ncbi:MAG: hypothetical protein ACFFCH_10910 [Promethearchaeota archaeon]
MTAFILILGLILLLSIINIGTVIGIKRRLVGHHYILSCNGAFLSSLFAFIAVVIAFVIFPYIWSLLEFMVVSFSVDAILIMLWLLWMRRYFEKPVYR